MLCYLWQHRSAMSGTFSRRFVGARALPWLGTLLFSFASSGCNPSFETEGASCTISCPAGDCPSGLDCNPHGFCTVNAVDNCTATVIDAHPGPPADAPASRADAAPPQSPAFVQMSAGPQHVCGITGSGELYCWGDNQFGQLGFNSPAATFNFGMPVASPLVVPQVGGPWAQVSAGTTHTCAVTTAKTLYCWGDNSFNEVAASTAKSLPPSPVTANSPSDSPVSWLEVAAGGGFTCARGVDSDLSHPRVYCWGKNNVGQMGNNMMSASQPSPMPIGAPGTDFDKADQLSAADRHICAHTSSNNVYCWGSNQDDTNVINGQSLPGQTTTQFVLTPTQVPGFDGQGNDITASNPFTSVSAGDESTCAVLDGSLINCWGSDVDNALGGGPAVNGFERFVPTPQEQFGNWTAVAVGRDSACGVFKPMPTDEAPVVECWGIDNNGNRGTVTQDAPIKSALPPTPSPITPPSRGPGPTRCRKLFCVRLQQRRQREQRVLLG